MKDEIWKDIQNYEGIYQISNLGRVKSLQRFKNNQYNTYLIKEKILKLRKTKFGYYEIKLNKNNLSKVYKVHRLVAQAFLDDYNENLQVNHKDENKLNNCVENLEMCNSKYNCNYGTRNDKIRKPIIQLDKNDNIIKIWESASKIEKELGIKQPNIIAVCKGTRKSLRGFKWKYQNI